MSPKRFGVRSTFRSDGLSTSSIAARSTRTWRSGTPGYSVPTSVTTRRQSADVSSTFALSTDATPPPRLAASSNATRAIRSISEAS
jgi:hypothetical protein